MKREPSNSTRALGRDRAVHDDPQAMSLHIGLNCVDPEAYAGWVGELSACEADARALATAAGRQGFAANILLTRRAKRQAVLRQVRRAANLLGDGGFFWISFSGHGGQVPDRNGDEPDGWTRPGAFTTASLIDDELTTELTCFRRGVRVLVTTDCCHSGVVARELPSGSAPRKRVRMMPPSVAQRTYDGAQRVLRRSATQRIWDAGRAGRSGCGSGARGGAEPDDAAGYIIRRCRDLPRRLPRQPAGRRKR